MADPAAPIRRNTTPVRVMAVQVETVIERPDRLATEEPMEIRAGGPGQEPSSVAVTMRTPGGDFASPAVVTISSPDNPSDWRTDYYDITQLLKDWLNGTYPNCGVILKCEVESDLKWSIYESDDSVQAEQYKPALVVDYEEAAPAADDISPIATMIRRRRR